MCLVCKLQRGDSDFKSCFFVSPFLFFLFIPSFILIAPLHTFPLLNNKLLLYGFYRIKKLITFTSFTLLCYGFILFFNMILLGLTKVFYKNEEAYEINFFLFNLNCLLCNQQQIFFKTFFIIIVIRR